MFKKEVCEQYYNYNKNKTSPHIIFGKVGSVELKTIYLTKKNRRDLFDQIDLEKNLEFNFHVDTVDIIFEKSIISNLSK